ncbi:MAG TPA: GNAT family N-acetyltransferase [Agriterribacter sp.]|nr:GNAT family N-acetyltransferase [Agriterribacter sp.]
MEIRNITQKHYEQVAEIYRQGIATGMATFQDEVPGWEAWNSSHLPGCRIAAFEGDTMLGWAALTPVSGRCVYAGVAEVSVYVSAIFRTKGIGKALLLQLIQESEQAGFWTLQSAVFPDNIASIVLHEKCGFRKMGYREKIGQKNGVWKDNIVLERRSKVVGV